MIGSTGNRLTFEIARQGRLAQDIARSQIRISTGKRIQQSSEDPIAAARAAQLDRSVRNGETWSRNLGLAKSLAAEADTALSALSTILARAQELTLAGSTGSASPADRATLAQSLRGLVDEVTALRATPSSLGTPLFGAQAAKFRVEDQLLLAPVAAAGDVFRTNGTTIETVLASAVDAISRGDATAIGTSLASLKQTIDRVADVHADHGARAARVDALIDRQAARGIDLASERSSLEDTDIASAVATLNAQTLTLDAARAAFARINRRTLFDILG